MSPWPLRASRRQTRPPGFERWPSRRPRQRPSGPRRHHDWRRSGRWRSGRAHRHRPRFRTGHRWRAEKRERARRWRATGTCPLRPGGDSRAAQNSRATARSAPCLRPPAPAIRHFARKSSARTLRLSGGMWTTTINGSGKSARQRRQDGGQRLESARGGPDHHGFGWTPIMRHASDRSSPRARSP